MILVLSSFVMWLWFEYILSGATEEQHTAILLTVYHPPIALGLTSNYQYLLLISSLINEVNEYIFHIKVQQSMHL